MPITTEDRNRIQLSLQERVAQVATWDIETLLRRDLTEISFEMLRIPIGQLVDLAKRLEKTDLSRLSHRNKTTLLNQFDQVVGVFTQMTNFNLLEIAKRNENPLHARNNLLSTFDQIEPAFWQEVTAIAALAIPYGISDQEADDANLTAHLRTQLDQALKKAMSSQLEVDAILAAVKTSASESGVATHAKLFADEATGHNDTARLWLLGTALAAVITGAAAYLNVQYNIDNPPVKGEPFAFQLAVAKLIGFSFLLTATVWCGRIYRAARHNVIVNRHRQNALSSFETFVAGATDEQTKNAVLLQATQSIFVPQSSGFVSVDAEAGPQPQMIELIRTITPGK